MPGSWASTWHLLPSRAQDPSCFELPARDRGWLEDRPAVQVVGELEVTHGVHAEFQRDGACRRVEVFDIGHPLNGIGRDGEPQIARVVRPEALVEDRLRFLENVLE